MITLKQASIIKEQLKDVYIVSLALISLLAMAYVVYTEKFIIIGAYGAILLMATCGIYFVKWVRKWDGW